MYDKDEWELKFKLAIDDINICLASYGYFKRRLKLTDEEIRELSGAYHYDEQYMVDVIMALVNTRLEQSYNDESNELLKKRDKIKKDLCWVQSFYYAYIAKHPELIDPDEDALCGYE